jgi:hypothetical protein
LPNHDAAAGVLERSHPILADKSNCKIIFRRYNLDTAFCFKSIHLTTVVFFG